MILPVFSYGAVIDSMTDEWPSTTDSTATVTVSIAENANKIDYDIGDGEWVAVYNDRLRYLDMSDSDSLSFYLKGSGNSNNLKIQIYDADGDVFVEEKPAVTDSAGWRRITLPFEVMDNWPGVGNGSLDKAGIKKLGFVVTPYTGGSGSITIDSICGYRLNTDSYYPVASFENADSVNDAGGNSGPMSATGAYDPQVSYDKNASYEGIYSLKLHYDMDISTWCGYWMFITAGNETGKADLSSYKYLSFYVKSDAAGKKFKIELTDKDKITSVQLSDVISGGTSTSWKEIKVPFSSFSPPLLSTAVKQINIIFDQSPREGTIWFDYFRFLSSQIYTEGEVETHDEMDFPVSLSGWGNFGRESSSGLTATSRESVSGYENKAIRLNYSFNRESVDIADWVALEREWALNLAGYNTIAFSYKGSGASNNLEVKLKDKNGSVYQRKFYGFTDTGGRWREILIPLEEFVFLENQTDSSNENLDLMYIYQMDFAITKNEGGAGAFYIKDIQASSEDDYSHVRTGKLIESLKVTNNPFSPNGDGIEDTAFFVYSLKETSKVKLSIFDLEGKVIYEKSRVSSSGAEDQITWNGLDSGGDTIKNGMYFYKIEAETDGGRTDSIIHVIGVMR